ncbi:MAG: PilZ domain-containing protein [candidate division Zixibacteria bacterium]|nr:PilZ domain-containing protein [candidate division Zixibacteria bacterium]
MSNTKNSGAKLGIGVPEKLNLPPLTGKSPFPIRSSQGRKYVRIEITSPVDFRLLISKRGRIRLSKDKCSGKIMNLSCGGILLESGEALPEGTFVLLSLNLNGVVVLEGVLGKIKRVEPTEDGEYLVGVEFCLGEELERFASKEQIEKLPVKVGSFNHKLKEIISGYIRTAHLATQSVKTGF